MTIVTWIRHAEPFSDHRDPELTEKGKEQAAALEGEYDLVVVSILRRSRETLQYSKIKYSVVRVSSNCREQFFHDRDHVAPESFISEESSESVRKRVELFRQELQEYSKSYARICIISHACFTSYFCGIHLTHAQQAIVSF